MRIGESGTGFVTAAASPVIIPRQQLPSPTTLSMPGMVPTARFTSEVAMGNGLGLVPADLVMPLPSITDTAPVQVAQCNSFSGWIDENPIMAGGLLLGLAWFTFRKKG